MKKRSAILALVLFSFALSIEAAEIHVAPSGNDRAVGTQQAPFATLAEARHAVRQWKRENVDEDMTVYLHGGTYYLDETFVLDVEDSAPAGRTITYAAWADEQPILSPARPITGWRRLTEAPESLPAVARDNIWVADIPETLGGKWRFLTLYDGETRLPRARTDGFAPTAKCAAPNQKYRWDDLTTLEFPQGELKNWKNLEDVEILIRPTHQWLVNYLPLASVDEKNLVAKTAVPGTYMLGMLKEETWHDRPTCWVENVLEGLDRPGEWVLNTQQGRLYLWPTGQTPGNHIMAPLLRELVLVEGVNTTDADGDRPVTGIVLDGLTFIQGERDLWTNQTKGIQHDWEMYDQPNAAIRFRGAKDCTVRNCTIRNTAGTGIRVDLFGQNINIHGNTLDSLGGSGILLCGYGPGTKDVNHHNQIVNNSISRTGQLLWHSPAIFIWQSGKNIARNNRIFDLPYDAIVISGVRPRFYGISDPVKWLPDFPNFKDKPDLRENMKTIRWDEVGQPKTAAEARRFAHARNNVIRDNELHDVMQMLGDGNAIYFSCAGEGNSIRRNLIYNSRRTVSEIRFDDDQEESMVRDNIIFGNGIKLKHTNYIENNILIGGQIHIRLETAVGAVVSRNVILATKDREFFYHMQPELLNLARPDYNLLYCPDETKGKALVAEARSKGHERHGIFADPQFVDIERGNLQFKPTSPAWKLGIEPIDTEKIGLLDDPAFPRLRRAGFRQAVDREGTLDF